MSYDPTTYAAVQAANRRLQDMKKNTLTKREQFAMAAMQGLIIVDSEDLMTCNKTAEIAILHADALIKELEESE